MISKLKTIISYFVPVTVAQRKGKINPYLEVNLHNGIFLLDTDKVNYSFGGGYIVFEKTFEHFQIRHRIFSNVLMLGFGAGSVANILTEKYGLKCKITGIEKDPVVIELAKQYFNIDNYKNLELICEDAYTFVQQNNNSYDLIVMDIFIDDEVPKSFHKEEFLYNLNRLLASNGILFYNIMTKNMILKSQANNLSEKMKIIFGDIIQYKIKIHCTENTVLVHDRLNK